MGRRERRERKGRSVEILPVFISTVSLHSVVFYTAPLLHRTIVTASVSLWLFLHAPASVSACFPVRVASHRGQGRDLVSEMGNRFQAGKGRTIADRQDRRRGEGRIVLRWQPRLNCAN